jgi:hypothetical protein
MVVILLFLSSNINASDVTPEFVRTELMAYRIDVEDVFLLPWHGQSCQDPNSYQLVLVSMRELYPHAYSCCKLGFESLSGIPSKIDCTRTDIGVVGVCTPGTSPLNLSEYTCFDGHSRAIPIQTGLGKRKFSMTN